ncbi:hypothetical protein IH785_12985 [candidate division KSB1 bacterium]|nr:hypothetical protein [candidate division KSB1 bacterium]
MDDSLGKITSGLAQDNLVLKTIAFVYNSLPGWRDDPNRPREQSEKKLNLQLVKLLGSQARNDFPMICFNHEEYQHGTRSIDISASPVKQIVINATSYTVYDPFLVLECKRLPADRKAREIEYVTGLKEKTGGIQRFKLGLHGSKLDIVVMIGYLQKDSTIYWYKKINSWISQLCSGIIKDVCNWNTDELLESFKEDPSKSISSCRSIHSRIESNSTKVEIYHLWIMMN